MLVSCITPTYNRRGFFPRSLRCFLSQDYPEIEWVIVDNGTDPIYDLLPNDSRIHYYSISQPRLTHGELMNIGFSHATGEVCVVHDDDDWYAPTRISKQVAPFSDPDIMITGFGSLYYYVHETQKAYLYRNLTSQPWVGAFAMRKLVWKNQKFEHVKVGADVRILNTIPQSKWKDLNDLNLMVAAIHTENSSSKNLPNASFIETPWEEIEKLTEGTLLAF